MLPVLLVHGIWGSAGQLVPLAHTLVALPFVVRTLQPALASIPDRLRQAAASLGASPLRVWAAVDWPIVARATLGAAVFALTGLLAVQPGQTRSGAVSKGRRVRPLRERFRAEFEKAAVALDPSGRRKAT